MAQDAWVDIPETRYAKTVDGVHIAHQVLGHGPVDLVYVPGLASHLEYAWQVEAIAGFYRRLAATTRLILVDRRGTGMSDRVPDDALPTIEARIDDVRAVLDEIGSERAALFGEVDSGSMGIVFAATHPSRCAALILWTPDICGTWAPDWPWGWTPDRWNEQFQAIERAWGTEEYVRDMVGEWAPSLARDPALARSYANLQRNAVSPGAALSIARMEAEIDVRRVLPTVQVPTLVLRRQGDDVISAEELHHVVDAIPGARYDEVPGSDEIPWVGDRDAVVDAVARFLASVQEEQAQFDRVLATVLFTDIVGSTEKAAEIGDAAWKDLVERHHRTARALIGRYRGTEIDNSGDGFLATFDGPARGVRCAQAVTEAMRPLGLEVRAGLHTGEVETIDGKVGGIAVHIGARVGALAGPSQVFVSQTVKDLVAGSGLAFENAGEHELKGVPDRWHLYRVVNQTS